MRGFAQGFLDSFRATSGTVFAGDPNADSSDVSRGIIKTSAIAALGAGAAGAAGAGASGGAISSGTAGSSSGGGFFGATGGLTGTAGIAPSAAGVGTAGSTIPFSTGGISGGSIAAGTAGGGAGFFGNTGGLSGQAGIAPQTQAEPSFLDRLNSQRSNINRGRRLLNQQNQGSSSQQFNDERNRFLTEVEQRQQQAALTGNPAAMAATGITTSGQLFSRSLQASLGAEDPREFRARAVQEATLEASQFEPGTPEFTQAATQAFARRGLAGEANNAQQQGLQAELRSAQIANQLNRAKLLDEQTRQLVRESNQATTGGLRLSREEILKAEGGERAWSAAGQEVLRRNIERRARGDKVTSGRALRQEVEELATWALDNLPESRTEVRGDTGTSFTRNIPGRFSFNGIGQPQEGIGQPRRLAQPPPPSLQEERRATQELQAAVETPVVKNEVVTPTAVRNASFQGSKRIKAQTRPIQGEVPRERRTRLREAREAQNVISSAVRPLNAFIAEVRRHGPILDKNLEGRILGQNISIPFQDLADALVNNALPIVERLPFVEGTEGEREERVSKAVGRARLTAAYEEFLNGLAVAKSKGVLSDDDFERFKRQALKPTSLAASNLGRDGMYRVYARVYEGILGELQEKANLYSTDMQQPEFPPEIRRILREGR